MTTYAAHIVTTASTGYGDAEIIVMTQADETGAADPIVGYPLVDGTDPDELLADNGWCLIGDPTNVDEGYSIVDVEPFDWTKIVKQVTFERERAQANLERQNTAWRTIIRDAMNDEDTQKTKVAEAAGVSRERAYQIRDGRR
jgi:hypothetical protein